MNANTVENAAEALDAAFNRRDLEAVLDEAGLTNPRVREFVMEYAELTGADPATLLVR